MFSETMPCSIAKSQYTDRGKHQELLIWKSKVLIIHLFTHPICISWKSQGNCATRTPLDCRFRFLAYAVRETRVQEHRKTRYRLMKHSACGNPRRRTAVEYRDTKRTEWQICSWNTGHKCRHITERFGLCNRKCVADINGANRCWAKRFVPFF